jgi:hypothetical protein
MHEFGIRYSRWKQELWVGWLRGFHELEGLTHEGLHFAMRDETSEVRVARSLHGLFFLRHKQISVSELNTKT